MNQSPGEYCGNAILDGTTCEIFTKNGHFGQVFNGKFYGHVKKSTLRRQGIFSPDKARKKIYGQTGYVGAPKR
jgi:hypothetical protein